VSQGIRPVADKSAQKSTGRYEIDHELIAEEENDGSSFVNPKQEDTQEINDEEEYDGRSQLSQSLIGAHLIKDKDYPFQCG